MARKVIYAMVNSGDWAFAALVHFQIVAFY